MKLRRVTPKSMFMVACLTLASVCFIIAGVIQYTQAAHVCASDETLQGNSCVSQMGSGTFALDKSSTISDDHIGGISLMVTGLLALVFSLVMIFSMYNFLSDQKMDRELAAAASEPEAE